MSIKSVQLYKAVILLFCIAALTACSFRFIYNHVDFGLVWKVDDFFDLTSDQKDLLEQQFVGHLKWHRESELSAYLAFLHEIQKRVAKNIELEDVQWFYSQIRVLRANLGQRMLPDAVAFFRTVDEEQIEHLRRALETANEDFIERAAMTPEARAAKRASTIINGLWRWTGDLTDVQEAYITEWSNSLPDVTVEWLAYRRSRQQEFINLVEKAAKGEEMSEAGYEWFTRSRPQRFAYFFRAVDETTVAIYKILNEEQRQHIIDEIQDWMDDIQSVLDDHQDET